MTPEQIEALMGNIPSSEVKQRKGAGGAELDYVSGEYVMRRLLEVLGPDGWGSSFRSIPTVRSATEAGGKWTVVADAAVRIEVPVGDGSVRLSREDIGVGISTQRSLGDATEMALKTAATDAFKRAARQLGNAVGLALYDKDQVRVGEDAPPEPTKRGGRNPADNEVVLTAAIDACTSEAEFEALKGRIIAARDKGKVEPPVAKALAARLIAKGTSLGVGATPAPEGTTTNE